MTPSAPAIQAIGLSKVYQGDVHAVTDVSFEVARGEAFGFLGPNGAGKSTTIGMLNTTVTPTSGSAMLGGRDVAKDPIGTRALSSVVFQDPVVDEQLSGFRNLEQHLRLWGCWNAEGRARVLEFVEVVGLSDYLHRPVSTYSGGQRRRMEIVRALVSQPQVVFLDEPTVGLDTRIRHGLFDVLATLRERTGVTILLTTHYLDEAERLCDRIAVIDAGRIVACDAPSRMLAALGEEVLEMRVSDPGDAVAVLHSKGVADDDVTVVGAMITVSLRGADPNSLRDAVTTSGVTVRSFAVRPPTLDDVYLRLTGGHISAEEE